MKNIFLFLFCFSLHSLAAQITIDQDDFADAGDTARMSVATWNPLLNFSATDTNYTWDFSSLQWQSQYVDQFLNPLNTGVTYAITFSNTGINPYRSNIAKAADNTLTTLPILSSVFTDGVNFFYKTSSLYRQRGLGMKVSGFSTPVPMSNPDTLYRFPMNYGNQDSAYSDYRVFVPQLGVYVHKQHRINEVDGWGTLITPFGTFDALRVRTEITGSDSLFIDTLNSGFKVENDIIREYKWFGKNQLEPLLQINTQAGVFGQFPGFEFVTRIVYRDSVRFLPTGIFDMAKDEIQFSVFPNPSNGSFFVSVPVDLTSASIKLTDISGRLILQREMNMSTEQVNTEVLSKGIYILTLQSNRGTASKKLVVE
jgi:hypothetical protein